MAAPMVRPSARVGAARRRALLWLPMLVAGLLVSIAGGSMLDVFNGLDLLGLMLSVGGLLGFASEVDK